jgi:hypothetical protein
MDAKTFLESRESPDMREIRAALGVITNAVPAVYWVFRDEGADWCVRREGEPGECSFRSENAALAFIRLAVVRCSSYCLFRERSDGRFVKEYFNWLPPAPEGRS